MFRCFIGGLWPQLTGCFSSMGAGFRHRAWAARFHTECGHAGIWAVVEGVSGVRTAAMACWRVVAGDSPQLCTGSRLALDSPWRRCGADARELQL